MVLVVQFLKQMYVLVLGLDVLGNPFGLIRGLSEGVEAFFYEPFQVMRTDTLTLSLTHTRHNPALGYGEGVGEDAQRKEIIFY